MKKEEITGKGGERKKRLHGTNERPRAYYRLYLQQPTANSPVRQMQPYVVAVLINAAANPLGVDSFIFFFLYVFFVGPSAASSFFHQLAFLPPFFNFISRTAVGLRRTGSRRGIIKARKNCRQMRKICGETTYALVMEYRGILSRAR